MIVPGANAVVDILRDADADSPEPARDRDVYGDEIETTEPEQPDGTVVAAGVPMSIAEQVKREPVDGDLRTVSGVVGRASPDVDVRVGDRLREAAGAIYSVDSVTRPDLGYNRQPYVRMDLTRTT